ADKGFKGILEEEFKYSTKQSIEIYSKEDKQKLDYYIEVYSSEKNIKTKLNSVENNLNTVVSNVLKKLKLEKFSTININGVLCEVKKLNIEPEIIDLNEIGDFLFNFKIKGDVKAEKPGIQYDFNVSFEFILETDYTSE